MNLRWGMKDLELASAWPLITRPEDQRALDPEKKDMRAGSAKTEP